MGAVPLTVGTAGHIDHGKTALVRALTGCETDRLAEERRRGISIELGFAPLDLGARRLSLIDVPGHEKLVRAMIAGASGIDLFLLAVAADDGPMPQTREHLAVLRALGVETGVIALTKVDLVDDEARLVAEAECEELLPGTPLVAVSSRSGEGLDALRDALAAAASAAEPAPEVAEAEPLLHVDRRFTVAGRGTVVTGTLWSGTLARGGRVSVLPAGIPARVRAIEVHGESREEAGPRQRVALNLAGPRREEVSRGDVVTVPGAAVATTYRLDVDLVEGAAEIAAERRAQVHLGTRESPARVVELGPGRVQLRLERPLLARRGDRVVVRRIAPPDTLGGGTVRDPAPPRHGAGWSPAPPPRAAPMLPRRDDDEAAAPGPLARRVLAVLEADGPRPRAPGPLAESLGAEQRQVDEALRELVAAEEVVRVGRDIAYPAAAYAELCAAIVELSRRGGSTSIAEVRDELGVSRKYAQALLERLDAERVLRREGDRHHLREVPQHA